jgi:polysaccharide export outer membrane protein
MPVTSHGRSRSPFGALLALCAVITGCQSQTVSGPSDGMHVGPLFNGSVFQSLHDRLAGGPHSDGTPTVVLTHPTTVARTPAVHPTGVNLVRPAAAKVSTDTGAVSSWQPVQRIGVEGGPALAEQPAPATPTAPAVSPMPRAVPTSTFVPAQPVPTQSPQTRPAGGVQQIRATETMPGKAARQGTPGLLAMSRQATPDLPPPTALGAPTVPGPEMAGPPPEVYYPGGPPHGKPIAAGHMVNKKGPYPGVPGVPKEFEKKSLPTYVIEPPDQLIIQSPDALKDQPLSGVHLVRPDGTVNLGIYGDVYLAGLTLDMARAVITAQVRKRVADFTDKNLVVDVYAYNSKVYYIITDGGGYGAQLYRLPVTGNETVLDALAQINGLPPVASTKKIWVARATPGDGEHPKILPVDWKGIAQLGLANTNYQVLPGDRIFVSSDPWIRADTAISKRLSPVNQILGTTLLGASTYNAISGRFSGGGSGGGLGTVR